MSSNIPDQFFGGHFSWFTGVVEDIMDPMQMGRVRVRCFGYHTEDLVEIPTESLPWALVMTPITSASMTGIGQSPTGVLQGSWVVGFFRDGPSAQDPIVLGTIPSISKVGDKSRGFSDPAGVYPRPDRIGDPDVPVQSRSSYTSAYSYFRRNDLKQTNIETAVAPKVSSLVADEPDSYYTRSTWSNWNVEDVVAPVYPSNHSTETESGHVFEVDDTPSRERIFEFHKSGTYREINATGDQTITVVGNQYTVIFSNDNIYVKGNVNMTVDGDLRQLVKGNYHLEVLGNYTQLVNGSLQTKIGQSSLSEIGKDLGTNVSGNQIHRVGLETTVLRNGSKNETINGNSLLTIMESMNQIVLGSTTQYSAGNIEVTTSGHLYVVSSDIMKLETPSDMLMNIDGSQTTSIRGSQITSVNGSHNMSISGSSTISASSSISMNSSSAITVNSSSTIYIGANNSLTLKGNPVNVLT